MFSLQRLRPLCGSVVVLLIGTWVASCSSSDAASSDPASIREAQLRFVKNYVTAIRTGADMTTAVQVIDELEPAAGH